MNFLRGTVVDFATKRNIDMKMHKQWNETFRHDTVNISELIRFLDKKYATINALEKLLKKHCVNIMLKTTKVCNTTDAQNLLLHYGNAEVLGYLVNLPRLVAHYDSRVIEKNIHEYNS